ncbi:MAG: F0F1 ATP synthase subunit delta [Candidatus Sungbacteria bacterium]|nr:F0F1 ATP synthase subunit delta [Candidatus Sungbacteria bacterium]
MTKYSISQYAAALILALEEKSGSKRSETIRRFLFIVRKNKDWSKLGRIVKEAEKQSLKKQGIKKVEVESAAPLSRAVKKEIEKIIGAKVVLEEKVRPEVLAGIKVLVDDEILIDASGISQVERMFVGNQVG